MRIVPGAKFQRVIKWPYTAFKLVKIILLSFSKKALNFVLY